MSLSCNNIIQNLCLDWASWVQFVIPKTHFIFIVFNITLFPPFSGFTILFSFRLRFLTNSNTFMISMIMITFQLSKQTHYFKYLWILSPICWNNVYLLKLLFRCKVVIQVPAESWYFSLLKWLNFCSFCLYKRLNWVKKKKTLFLEIVSRPRK